MVFEMQWVNPARWVRSLWGHCVVIVSSPNDMYNGTQWFLKYNVSGSEPGPPGEVIVWSLSAVVRTWEFTFSIYNGRHISWQVPILHLPQLFILFNDDLNSFSNFNRRNFIPIDVWHLPITYIFGKACQETWALDENMHLEQGFHDHRLA